MNTDELEKYLNGRTETQRFEIKRNVSWDVKIFAKPILALSNVRDGGYIIVGVENDFTRIGLTDSEIKSFNLEIMKDQMSRYADPSVDFLVKTVNDLEGKKYVSIRVLEFKDIPIICKISDETAKLKGATIYYRNSDGRFKSAPVSTSNDLRYILELATIKKLSYWKDLGLMVENTDNEKFNQELGGL